jgi:transitional endoplasmic reticulum ATPase
MSNEKPITLRVGESLPKDVGRGIVRMDPKDIAALGIGVGDVVAVKAGRETAAKAMPTFPQFRDKGVIQMDGIIRENAEVGLDEKVRVSKAGHAPASSIALRPLTLSTARGERDNKYISRLLEGLPVCQGDRVRANLFGAKSQDFSVLETAPKGIVLVTPETTLRIRHEETASLHRERISYEDIGGLHREIQRVREMIELPLKYPQILQRLGIEAPKGVLLLGPPGTGKTLIAKAVANETDAHFTAISGPEIIHKFYGESEARLRNIFEEAGKNAPSIIFLDEIDAIAPKRESVIGEVEKRVVAQLLALMDGLSDRGQVVIIGATNIPNALDPALRRPGRFDREISIGVPDKAGRLEILQIHTRGMPLSEDVDLAHIAGVTHGFVGADLAALAREAAMVCLRTILPDIDFQTDSIPYEKVMALQVTMPHFLEALKEVEPSATREVSVEVPNVSWSQVGGLEGLKEELTQAIEWPLLYPDLFQHTNTSPPKGLLLFGPPGTGKTLLAKALATESQVNFISIKGPALLSKWVGESEKGVRELFKKARQTSPCILFFDEIDALAPHRGGGADSHVTERVISQLLTEMDGIEELRGVVVLAATNRLDLVDPALLRPGRFDLLLQVPPPDEKARLEILRVHTRGKPLDDSVNLEAVARHELLGAEIEALCRKASMLAIAEFLQRKNRQPELDISQLVLSDSHFQAALSQFSGRAPSETRPLRSARRKLEVP